MSENKELGSLNEIFKVLRKSPFYVNKYSHLGNLDEIPFKELPFLTKYEILTNAEQFLTVPLEEISYIYFSSINII